MTQKPLSNERREEIVRLVKAYPIMPSDGSAGYLYAIADLLADAEFWRNAVKNAEAWIAEGPNDVCEYHCEFCEAFVREGHDKYEHKDDCAYELAKR